MSSKRRILIVGSHFKRVDMSQYKKRSLSRSCTMSMLIVSSTHSISDAYLRNQETTFFSQGTAASEIINGKKAKNPMGVFLFHGERHLFCKRSTSEQATFSRPLT